MIRDGHGDRVGLGLGHRDRLAHRHLDRLRREAVADPEVGVDVAPGRRDPLELGAQLAHEDVDRAIAVDHGVAPDALVDLLALQDLALGLGQQLDELELAPRQLDRDARRRTPGTGRRGSRPRRSTTGPFSTRTSARLRRRTTASMRAISSSGMAGLGDPVVGAEPQPAHALGDRGLPRADDHAQPGQPRAELVEVVPALRARAPPDRPRPRSAAARPSRPAAPARPARGAASPCPPGACPAPAGNRCRNRSPPGGPSPDPRRAAPLLPLTRACPYRHLAAETSSSSGFGSTRQTTR